MKPLVFLSVLVLVVESSPQHGRALVSPSPPGNSNPFKINNRDAFTINNPNQDGGFEMGVLGAAATLTKPWSKESLDMSHHFLSLLPDFSSAIDGLSADGGLFRPSQMISTFTPIIRDAYMLLAEAQKRNITKEEEANLDLAETIMKLTVGVTDEMIASNLDVDVERSVRSYLDITRPIVEAWAKRRHRQLNREEKTFLHYFENGYKFFFDITNDFKDDSRVNMIKTNSKIAEFFLKQRAEAEGRGISPGEKKLITEIEKQIFTNFEIMDGFSNFNNTQQVIDTIVLLTKYIMETNAFMELPRRYHLDHSERALIGTAKKAMQEVDSMLNEIDLSGLSYERFNELAASSRKMWDVQMKREGRQLTEKEKEYLKFSDGVANLAKSLYVRY